MKRRKNIIISAITCMFSICLMMFGVYAAASPTITLSGQVSYTVRDAKVLVLGKVNGQSGEDQTNKISYPTVADMTSPTVSEKVTESTTQYMSFTKGDGNSEADQLDTWNLSTHTFYEDNTGIRPITISMKLSNLSNYPVLATVAYTVSDATLATGNLTRTTTGLSESTVYLPMSSTKEISITYDVLDDSKSVSGTNLVGMTVTFAKTVEPTASNAYYTTAEGTSQELTLSDWEYIFEGDSYTITKYVGDLTSVGENLYIPSSITTSNGNTYPVKALGAVDMTSEEAENNLEIESELDLFGYSILHDMDIISAIFENEDLDGLNTYIASLPTVIVPEGIEKINICALLSTPIQSLPTSIKSVESYGVCDFAYAFGVIEEPLINISALNLPNIESIDTYAFVFNINLTTVTLGDKLESIGYGAFLYCDALTSVTIPSSVESIGEFAFGGCPSLTTVQVDGETPCECGEEIFGSVDDLASGFTIYVPNESYKTATNWEIYKDYMVVGTAPAPVIAEEEIGDWQVKLYEDNTATIVKYIGDLNKETLTIPATLSYEGTTYNVKSVGVSSSDYSDDDLIFVKRVDDSEELNYSFAQIISLMAFAAMKDGATVGDVQNFCNNFESHYVIPKFKNVIIEDGIQIVDGCFLIGCYTLESITIPQSVTKLGDLAFIGCENLKSISLPNKLKSIGGCSFSMCLSLQEILIPNDVTSIGDYAFACSNGLKSITLSDVCKNIGEFAFTDCKSLTSIIIPSSVTSIGSSAFNECTGLKNITIGNASAITDYSVFSGCSAIEEVTISSGDICSSLFSSTTSLKTLTLGEGVTSIGSSAFYNCTGLTSVTISGGLKNIDNNAFKSCTGLTSITIPSSVLSIGSYAFAYCGGLTSITIPSSVTSIGDCAFYGCYSLTGELIISSSVESIGSSAFSGCRGLTSVTISEGLKSIDSSAFRYCSGLTNVTIPSTVESIGDCAFQYCYRLAEVINLSSSLTITKGSSSNGYVGCYAVRVATSGTSQIQTVGDYKFVVGNDGSNYLIGYFGESTILLTLPTNGSYKIKDYAFWAYSKLTSITIPSSVTSIGDSAFYSCTGLTTIIIGNGVTSIGYQAFYDCYRLAEVINLSSLSITAGSDSNGYVGYYAVRVATSGESQIQTSGDYKFVIGNDNSNYLIGYFGEDTTSLTLPTNGSYAIHSGAFYRYSNLTSVIMPEGVTSIGSYAFAYCRGLTSITIPSSVTSIGSYAFEYCSGLTGELIIPSGVTSIGSSAFYGCRGLTSITIPSSVTSIGYTAFYGCSGLTSITIPSSVESMGEQAFAYCSGLTSITIPSSVTSIGYYAFEYCSGLKTVTFEGTTPPTSIGSSIFRNCSSLTAIYVPSESVDAYKTALSNYASLIKAIE